jgi:peptide/nickel transport system permease protein
MTGLRRFFSRWQNLLACVIVVFFLLVALAAPRLAPPDDPHNPSPFRVVGKYYNAIPQPPSEEARLGTVPGQLDVYHTLVWGTRSALRFGLIVALSTAGLGVLIGAFSGYFGGLINGVLMRVTDAFLTFPLIAGVLLFRQILFPTNQEAPLTWFQKTLFNLKLDPVMLTFILFSWMPHARIINTNVAQLKRSEYVQAARAVGAGNARIILRHLLPNAIPPAIVLVARDIGAMVILDAAFTFIGVGGSTEWGTLLVSGRDYVIGMGGNPLAYWWTFVPASLALVLFGVGWNLLGDGLNTMLNPRTARLKA